MKKTLLLIAIAAISGSTRAQTSATANQQSQNSQQTVQNDKTRVVDAKQEIQDSKLFSAKQKEVLNTDYKNAKSQYQTNMKALKANKNISPEEYAAQKEKINSEYAAYKSRYTQQKRQLNNSVKQTRHAASDGVITPEERASIKNNQQAGVAKYKQDKKANNKNKQKQSKP